MNKRQLYHALGRLRHVRYLHLGLALLLMLVVFVLAYRQNNVHAIKLRERLLQIDQQNGDVESALRDLREYTYSHMNANLSSGANNIYPPIQLKYRYERLIQAEQQKLAASNSQLYTEAQNFCEEQIKSRVTVNRVPCIQDYLSSHGVVNVAPQIPDALYKFDFVSPLWSPDLAGWSLVIVVLLALTIVGRFASERWLLWRLRM